MQKLIFDCDNTMGLPGREVDDGLALMYLLGRADVQLLGVTTTFGNASVELVHGVTAKMFAELGLGHIPLCKGAPSPTNRQSEAAEFLVTMVSRYPGEVTVLGLGALTNLFGAFQLDPQFFNKVKSIVLMGGLTKPLVINGIQLNELNFSCDPEAAYHVLRSEGSVTVITGHCCLQALFGKDDLAELNTRNPVPAFRYIRDKTETWRDAVSKKFGIGGFYNWDTVAAFYVTHPNSFLNVYWDISPSVERLRSGLIELGEDPAKGNRLNIPTGIKNTSEFRSALFNAWAAVHVPMMD